MILSLCFGRKNKTRILIHFLDIPQPTEERVKELFSSIAKGEHQSVDTEVENYFYCCTISSAAARIAVRDWIAISVSQYQK